MNMVNKLRASGQIQDKDRYISISETKRQMEAMLTEILLEAEENTVRWYVGRVDGKSDDVVLMETLQEIIQQKIDKLKGNENGTNEKTSD